MSTSNPHLLRRERNLILAVLLTLAAVAWGLLIWQAVTINKQVMGLTMGMDAALFVALWVVMMIAMMFPTAAPMVLMFRAVYANKRLSQQSFDPTWIFVGAYLLIWSLCGVLAYILAIGIEDLAAQSMWLMENATRFCGVILMAAGLYQLSPLKQICLAKCRTPLQFILTSWHEGYGGAFLMGLEHGIYCLGCCWLLFVLLFPLGIMNVAVMALLTVLIFAEKSLPIGRQLSLIIGVGLIAYGVLVIFLPAAFPAMM